MRTIAHVYPTYAEAARVVSSLESAGIPHSDISIVSGDKNYSASSHGYDTTAGTATGLTSGDPEQGAATGAGTGASLGTVSWAAALACWLASARWRSPDSVPSWQPAGWSRP